MTHPIVDIWQNFGYGLRVKRKEKYLYIWKCNKIINNSKKQNSGKYRLAQIKYGYQIKKESSFSKIHVACSNTDLFSL